MLLHMKKIILPLLSLSLVLSSCFTAGGGIGLSGTATGAMIGGTLGSIVGQNVNPAYGSQLGGLIGTIAGAAVGSQMSKQSSGYGNIFGNNLSAGDTNAATFAATNASGIEITNFRFLDENQNGTIDANESCKVSFEIINNSGRAITNLTPVMEMTSKTKGLNLAKTTPIASLPAHSKLTYSVPLKGTSKLRNGTASFRVYTRDGTGNYSGTREFSLATAR